MHYVDIYDKGIHTHQNEKQGFLSDFCQNHVGGNKKKIVIKQCRRKKIKNGENPVFFLVGDNFS